MPSTEEEGVFEANRVYRVVFTHLNGQQTDTFVWTNTNCPHTGTSIAAYRANIFNTRSDVIAVEVQHQTYII